MASNVIKLQETNYTRGWLMYLAPQVRYPAARSQI